MHDTPRRMYLGGYESSGGEESVPDDAGSLSGGSRPPSTEGESAARASPSKAGWMDDKKAKNCMHEACGQRFSLTSRKHHCRVCGLIFCSACLQHKQLPDTFGYKTKVRVCEGCTTSLFCNASFRHEMYKVLFGLFAPHRSRSVRASVRQRSRSSFLNVFQAEYSSTQNKKKSSISRLLTPTKERAKSDVGVHADHWAYNDNAGAAAAALIQEVP